MVKQIKQNTDKILLESKPASISLSTYKSELLSGKYTLTQSQQDRILQISSPLAEYGNSLAKKNNIKLNSNDLSEMLAVATINSRGLGLEVYSNENKTQSTNKRSVNDEEAPDDDDLDVIVNGDLTWGEVGGCVVESLGVDALWALGTSTGTS